uniref:CSC1/OSCA1-like 7TM region domain-containing protein n=1 Tax=Strigamia maritima TaxID=126957 RepID=T1IPX9_STRMM
MDHRDNVLGVQYLNSAYDDSLIPDNVSCNYYTNSSRTHVLQFFNVEFGYIPQNLAINFLVWVVHIVAAVYYSKEESMELWKKCISAENRTELFFGEADTPTEAIGEASDPADVYIRSDRVRILFMAASYISHNIINFSLTVIILTCRDEHILNKNGHDAVHYLRFQRYIIFFLLLLCVVCLAILLPINLQGTNVENSSFGRTTTFNLGPNSSYLWVHIFFAFLFFPISVWLMRRFSQTVKLDQENLLVNRTVMINHVPRENCQKSVIIQHFSEAYPNCEIQEVQFAYDIATLMSLDHKKEAVTEYRIWCENYFKERNERPSANPHICGCFCCNRCICEPVDAIQYYIKEENRLTAEVEREKIEALKNPLGIAFVTFDSEATASQVYNDHQMSCKCSHNPPNSGVARQLDSYAWEVNHAPSPEDIYWYKYWVSNCTINCNAHRENLSSDSDNWYIRAALINTALFFSLFFLTTPAIILKTVDTLSFLDKLKNMNPLISEFAPTLMIWLMACVLPFIVRYSDQFLRHWTRSAENHSIMRKSFIFLLFMVVILPSLGLTSAKAFVEWAVKHNNDTKYRWQCVFLPDNGAFFVNYVVTSALIGTGLELIRFPELFWYAMGKLCARSAAERAHVEKAVLWEFPFGTQYAWMLLNFAVTVIYSIPCPVIAPFGLLYMLLKHCVDRYNIYFAYGSSKISRKIHVTAINFVIAVVIILEVIILFFLFIRSGDDRIPAIVWVMLIGCCTTSFLYIGQMFCNTFKILSFDSLYKRFHGDSGESSASVTPIASSRRFVAPVLQLEFSQSAAGFLNLVRTYGTSGASSPTVEPSSTDDQGSATDLITVLLYNLLEYSCKTCPHHLCLPCIHGKLYSLPHFLFIQCEGFTQDYLKI